MKDISQKLRINNLEFFSTFYETLTAITAEAVRLIPGADHAGITLVTKNHRVDSRAATDDLVDDARKRAAADATMPHAAEAAVTAAQRRRKVD